MKRKIIALLIVMIMTLVMSACGNSTNSANETKEVINPGDPIVVSTMNDTEGEVLGRMMVLALKDAGFEVTDNTFGYTGMQMVVQLCWKARLIFIWTILEEDLV